MSPPSLHSHCNSSWLQVSQLTWGILINFTKSLSTFEDEFCHIHDEIQLYELTARSAIENTIEHNGINTRAEKGM